MIRTTLLAAATVLYLGAPARAEITDGQAVGALLAMMNFVEATCPTLRPNMAAVKERLTALNVHSRDDMTTPEVILAAKQATSSFTSRPASGQCAWISAQFGAGGLAVPDLFLNK